MESKDTKKVIPLYNNFHRNCW